MNKTNLKSFSKSIILYFLLFQTSMVFADDSCVSFLVPDTSKIKDIANEEVDTLKSIISTSHWNRIQGLTQSVHLVQNIYETISANDAIYVLSNVPKSVGVGVVESDSLLNRLSVNYGMKPWTEDRMSYLDVVVVFNVLEKLIPVDLDSKTGSDHYEEIHTFAENIVLESNQFSKKKKQIKARVLKLINLIMKEKFYRSSEIPKEY